MAHSEPRNRSTASIRGRRDEIRRLIGAVVVAGAAVVVGATLALAANDNWAKEQSAESTHPVAGPGPNPADLLSVFRGRQDLSAAESAKALDLDRALRNSGDALRGEAPTRMRRADHPAGTVLLWPMDGGVCTSFGACLPTNLIAERGVVAGAESIRNRDGSFEQITVRGIARDGIQEVRFLLEDGRELVAEVHDNVFVIDFGRTVPVEARWRNLDGRVGIQPHLVDATRPE